MGWLARKYGMQTNSVTAIELVTADGRFRRVTADERAGPVLGAARRQTATSGS
jgi:FAD/FMN-containing dehydrogenase